MEVCGVPTSQVRELSTRWDKFFEEDDPVQIIDSRGKMRIPGSVSLKRKLKGCDLEFLSFV